MRRVSKVLFLVFLITGTFAFSQGRKDTLDRKLHFHLGLSLKPALSWMSKIDSSKDAFFMSSPSLYELQISYKKHFFSFGFNYYNEFKRYTINTNDVNQRHIVYSLNPSYQYAVLKARRWTTLIGIGVLYSYNLDEHLEQSQPELFTTRTLNSDIGIVPMARLHLQINRRIALELETACYFMNTYYHYENIFPLTPSMTEYRDEYGTRTWISVPSNIILKFSI
jgi:hypothetical protein